MAVFPRIPGLVGLDAPDCHINLRDFGLGSSKPDKYLSDWVIERRSWRVRRRAQFHRLDVAGALQHLLGGDADVAHVAHGLVEMLLQFAVTVQPPDVLQKFADLGLMTCACSRIPRPSDRAHGERASSGWSSETIQTRTPGCSSTRFGKVGMSSA